MNNREAYLIKQKKDNKRAGKIYFDEADDFRDVLRDQVYRREREKQSTAEALCGPFASPVRCG